MKPLPWKTREPHAGRGWLVLAADGREVCEIDGECDGDGQREAEAIVRAMNVAVRTKPPVVTGTSIDSLYEYACKWREVELVATEFEKDKVFQAAMATADYALDFLEEHGEVLRKALELRKGENP